MYAYIVLGIFFGLFTFSMMLTMLKYIKEDSSTIDNKAKKKEPKGAQKSLLEKVPQIKRDTTFCQRLSDVFESNPRQGCCCWRKYKQPSNEDDDPVTGKYGFSLNWLFPVERLDRWNTTVEGELNLPAEH